MIARILFAAVLLAARAALAESEVYRYSRPVEWRGAGREELAAVLLDSQIFAATRADFADLRLLDQEGNETPYLLEKAMETRTETRRQAVKSELLGLKEKPDRSMEITLRLAKEAPAADGLTVFTPLTNFEHRIQVFGSADGKQWSTLARDAEIYDYSRYMAVSNRDVALPTNRYRQFKVVIEQATQTREAELLELTRKLQGGKEQERSERVDIRRIPLNIERIGFWRAQTEVLPETERKFVYPVVGFQVSRDLKNQATLIDITTSREPLTGFELQTSTRNFNRAAAVEILAKQGINTQMREIGTGTLESLHFRDINRGQTTLSFPEQRGNQYRIVIRDQDNPPLAINAVAGIGNGYGLLFLPQQGMAYSLRYGAEQARPARYDTAPIRELQRRGYESTLVQLGAETAAAPVDKTLDWAGLLNSKPFLIAVAVLMVAVLAWSLVHVGRRIENLPKE